MIAQARVATFEVLRRVELGQVHSDDALNSEVVAGLDPRDRALVTEIVYGSLRWRAWLDFILKAAVERAWEAVDAHLRILLRMSVYQMTHMDRLPDHAVVHDAVEMAKQYKGARSGSFVNGVLRNLGRERPWLARDFHRDCPMWVRLSLPRWLWDRWEDRFGTDLACEYASSLNRKPQAAFRICGGALPEAVPPALAESDIVPGAYIIKDGQNCEGLPGVYHQDESSQLIPHLLGSIRGANVWDACAAPGGKSDILLGKCGPDGRLIASDIEFQRALFLRTALRSRGDAETYVLVADATAPPPFRGSFDVILADVPCSGLGTLRRNPEIKWRFQPEWLQGLSQRQGRLLDALSSAVKKGGKLLYSTCSTEPEENEQVVRRFLSSHPDFRLLKPDYPPGVESWLDEQGCFRSFPSARLWDGFFAALITRE